VRTLTAIAQKAVHARETSDVVLLLLELSHVQFAQTHYLVQNSTDVTISGQTYKATRMSITLPYDADDQLRQLQVSIDNADQTLTEDILNAQITPPQAVIYVAVSNNINDPEITAGPMTFDVQQVVGTDSDLGLVLLGPPVLNEPLLGWSYTPDLFPGLFAADPTAGVSK